MSYMKRYFEWAVEKLFNDGFGTYEECLDYIIATPNEYLPRWLNMQAYIRELNKR